VFCVVRAVHTFTLGVLWAEHLTNGDQWKERHAMIETHVSGRIYTYRPFATSVPQPKLWHFWVIGTERNVCRCTFNRYSVI